MAHWLCRITGSHDDRLDSPSPGNTGKEGKKQSHIRSTGMDLRGRLSVSLPTQTKRKRKPTEVSHPSKLTELVSGHVRSRVPARRSFLHASLACSSMGL